ncbi:Eukaryotic translation initiation factor 2 subunit 2 [Hypsibius exemplaris]|uniref:Eukaryotic translation initiation factor 2 subunit 2 n=1 Tax=Hypsibius exemplaris TaxID=2072580 RepID=A0A1W0WWU0_HYPEX|nr:Eukaryotic translation initiation factor 2 subunit 2 [Hypsibius exemplaris]
MADEGDLNLELTTKKKKPKKPFNLEKALGDSGSGGGGKKEEEDKDEEALVGGADEADDLNFTGKKKKKAGAAKKVEDDEADQVKDDADEMDFGKKKKKPAKAAVVSHDDEVDAAKENAEAGEDSDGDEFGGGLPPKKKATGKSVTFVTDSDHVDGGDDEDGADFVEGAETETKPRLTPSANLMKGAWLGSDRDYTYDELLTRVFDIMREKNPEYVGGEKKKIVMRPPQVVKVGSKKTSFANFTDICKIMRRQPKHLIAFLLAELGTTGSVDANNQLIIKGRFQQKQIENVLRRYIKEYVTCHTCRSPETLLQKDDQTRVVFLQCETCGSRCSVTKVSSGYQALTAKRATIRAREV